MVKWHCNDGSWSSLRSLKSIKHIAKGRLRNLEGAIASSEQKAETLAGYYEKGPMGKPTGRS